MDIPDLEHAALAGRVAHVLDGRWPGVAVLSMAPLPGGISSLTYVVSITGGPADRVVVKVAPPGRPAVANRDVLRQARILQGLRGAAGVRVPAVLACDEGGDGEPPLFVMELAAGEAWEPNIDAGGAVPAPDVVRARAFGAVDQLVAIQAAPVPGAEAEGAEPVLSPAEELSRWRRLYATVTAPDLLEGAEEVAAALDAQAPALGDAGIVHGDYRLGNLLFDGGRLTAVIDWEIWSLGDRRLDLAWLAVQTHALSRSPTVPVSEAHRQAIEALPSAGELVAAYRAAGGPDPGDLAWWLALGDYKVGATLAVLIKQNRKRSTPDALLESRAPTVAATVRRAARHLEGGAW